MSRSNFVKCNPIHLYSAVVTARTITLNIKTMYLLPTECIDMFCMIRNTENDIFSVQE